MPIMLMDKKTGATKPLPKPDWKKIFRPSEGLAKKQEENNTHKKYGRILNLPPDMKMQIDEMIRSGYESSIIARTIQKDMNLHTDISEEGMRMYVSRYRQEMIPLTDQMPGMVGTREIGRLKKKLFKDVDLLEEMTGLINLTIDRINFDHEKEKKAKMSLMQNNNNISVAGKLMRDYGELAIKVGILRKLGDELDDIHKERPTALLDAALKDPDIRSMVHNSLNAMLIDLEKPGGVHIDAEFEESPAKDQEGTGEGIN